MPYDLESPSETTPLLAHAESTLSDEATDKADGFPRSRWEAMQHIEDIQRRREKYRGDGMVQGMLKQIQEQNSTTDRILYELLQNANDNDYGSRKPRMSLRYQNGYLLIETNEVGFSKANVEAICSAAESSKKADPSRRCVGEKGVGFKSVFKISRSVWIASGYYSFRFDRDREVGWIFPHWDDEPPMELTGGLTSILLHIDQDQQAEYGRPESTMSTRMARLLDQLVAMDLLFLPTIKHVEIETPDERPLTGWIPGIPGRRKVTLTAELLSNECEVLLDTMVSRDGIVEPLVAWQYKHPAMPSRRKGSANNLVLVFSRDIPLNQPIPTRKTYAFLPIRDYGFKFVVHADFKLVANRESIIQDPWNDRIIEHIPEAMVQAVASFRGRYPDLWYRWPLLLPIHGIRDVLFLGFGFNTKLTFSRYAIVEDVQGNCLRPHELHLVPKKFRDAQENPLLPPQCTRHKRLSERYPLETIPNLKQLGVKTLSDDSFLSDLAYFIDSCKTDFRRMSDSWHNEVCDLLLGLLPSHNETIKNMEIIPLSNTEWVSARYRFLYFGANIDGPALPKSIQGVDEINRQIQKTSERGKLFSALGAHDITKADLCSIIVRHHEIPGREGLFDLPVGELVSHLEFLYHAGWKPEGDTIPDFWCCTSAGANYKRQLSEVYMQSTSHYSASNVATLVTCKLHFMHPMYYEIFRTYDKGLEWLEHTLNVRTRIRVAKSSGFGGLRLHEDFRSLLAQRPLVALDLLRHHWSFYSSWFQQPAGYIRTSRQNERDAPDNLSPDERKILRDTLAETKVPCHGGHQAKLTRTYLATKSLLRLCETSMQPCRASRSNTCWICDFIRSCLGLSRRYEPPAIVDTNCLLEVSEPERVDWDFLRTFNVITKPGAALYLEHLRRIRGHPVGHKHMEELYAQLQNFCYGLDEANIRSVFQEINSIYVPDRANPRKGAWYSSSAVVWDGPSCLKHVPRLKEFYGHQFALFNSVLEKPIADLATLKTEAEHVHPRDTARIKGILYCISDHLRKQSEPEKSDMDWLRSCPIFPVFPAGSGAGATVLRSASETWLIPDRPRFHIAFLGVIDLSVFSEDDFRSLPIVSGRLDLSSRRLSEKVQAKRSSALGDIEKHGYAQSIRDKAHFISSLIPPQVSPRETSDRRRLLQNVRVFQSKCIETRWTVNIDGKELHSNPVQDPITSKIDHGCLMIYMAIKDELLTIGYIPIELSEELALFCGIQDNQDTHLLTKILAQNNGRLIKADLANRSRGKASYSSHVSAVRSSHIVASNFVVVGTGTKANDDTSTPQVSPIALGSEQNAFHEAVSETIDKGARTELVAQEAQAIGSGIDDETLSTPLREPSDYAVADQDEWQDRTEEYDTQDRSGDEVIASSISGADIPRTDDGGKTTPQYRLPDLHADQNEVEQEIKGSLSTEPIGEAGQISQPNKASSDVQVPPRVKMNGACINKEEEEIKTGYQPSTLYRGRGCPRSIGTGALPLEGSEEQITHAITASPQVQSKEVSSDSPPGSVQKVKRPSKDDSAIPLPGDRGRRGSLSITRATRSRSAIGTTNAPSFEQEWKILPRQESQNTDTYTQPIGARAEEDDEDFVNMAFGRFIHSSPRIVFLPNASKDTEYFGELYVSRYLSWFLGQEVERNKDKRHEVAAYEHEELPLSTFTVKDKDGRLRELLIQQGKIDRTGIDNVCTFYIDVLPTNQDASWPFSLSQALYKKAERLALSRSAIASKIYLLARVYKLLTDPGIAFYADPWALYKNGSISLEPTGRYTGVILRSAPVILQEDSLSVSMSAAGIYQGLAVNRGQIRLLKLELSDDDHAPLNAQLVRVSLDQHFRFWAISYCWGGKPGRYGPFIQINGIEVAVTESLWACLRCLRRKKVTALIWADAVCINQEDLVEKAMQVRRMGSIYRLADQVIIWLGSLDDRDDDAMQAIATMHSQPVGSGTILHGCVEQDLEAGRHVDALLQRSWFTRAWVIQELVFGSQVMVLSGHSELVWGSFIDGVIKCEAHMKRIAKLSQANFLTSMEPALALDRTRKHYSKTADHKSSVRLKYGFLALVEYFFYTESSRRRDKLFALLNLAWDTDHEMFQPDYQSSNETILARYASQFVEARRALELMYRAGRNKGSEFCSWIPDLMNQARRIQYPSTISTWNAAGINSHPGFCAGVWSSNDAKVVKHSGTPTKAPVLAMRGIMFDSIQSCTRPLNIGISIPFSKVLTDLRRFFSPLRMYPGCGPKWEEELLVGCLTGDAIGPQTGDPPPSFPSPSSSSSPASSKSERWPKGYREVVLDVRPDQDARAYLEKNPKFRPLIEQFWQTSSAFIGLIPRAAACITVRRYAGIVPGDARQDDRIFIPHDSKVPFVLRKKPATNCYELIGECYVHNVMYRGGGRTPGGSEAQEATVYIE